MTIKMSFEYFFDKSKVINAVKKADRKILNDVGRAIRRDAQKSLKYAEGPSRPGSPPHAHKTGTRKRGVSKKTGKQLKSRRVSYLREFLWYAFEPSSNSVVIGPAKLSGTVDSSALHALEEGGTSNVATGRGGTRKVSIRKRPYMKPAMNANLPNFRNMWKNSVRST